MNEKNMRNPILLLGLSKAAILTAFSMPLWLPASLHAFKDASGLITNPILLSEFFDTNVTQVQTLNGTATESASFASMEALSGLLVNNTWNGFTNIANTTGVANYLHFPGATSVDDRSVRFTTNYNSTNQSNWAGVGSTGADLVVSGTHAYYLGSIGGSWTFADITFGRLTGTGDDPAGTRNAAFATDAGAGLGYGVRAAGFVLSNVGQGRTFTAQFFDTNNNSLASISGVGVTAGADGDEIFFGHIAGANPIEWISRIVITGNNGSANAGLDNFGFTEITVIPEASSYASIFGIFALALGAFMRRRK
jgi:hypothetical protein